ncbi:TPA: helix-turn-helix transcriptional regulator [Bacillus thuringiensis]|uniref:helix-turn-helix domain-containing protein n=1 Tax=Bacillus thuringiensis TaxID=1428 RepID=UPI0018CECFF9|nr:helix-turn-helix transcriptional regulator [Bacillus thuringiensis]MEB9535095.1 helix-turn-helix transcriptional regulator [Bacillus cereus]MEB9726007.1 helix-turn-helix transcriptional regulator [Bacillus cereus]
MNNNETFQTTTQEEEEFLDVLGKRIKRIRNDKGFTQEELGAECNLHRTYIGGIERGERNPTILNLKRIADALGVSVNEVLGEKKPDALTIKKAFKTLGESLNEIFSEDSNKKE